MKTKKVIITVALTGGFHGKEANPNLPEQPDEIAQAAYDCWKVGAAIAHIHARDKDGKPTAAPEVYREINEKTREKCNIIIANTTGGGPNLTPEQRIRSVEAAPEMASLNMGTMVRTRWGEGTLFLNTRSQIESYAETLKRKGIKPELEVYSHSMMVDVQNLIDKELINKPYYINLVLGMTHQGALPATSKNLLSLIEYLPPESIFNVTAVGPAQVTLTTLSVILGGHVRVGLEDNIYYTKGVLARSNAQMVERAVRIVKELGYEIASPDEARNILDLKT